MLRNLDNPSFISCMECGNNIIPDSFLKSNNPFFPYGRVPVCNGCLRKLISDNLKRDPSRNWIYINKLCQWIDIPFIPDKWLKTVENSPTPADAFITYARIFENSPYPDTVNWLLYNNKFLELKDRHQLEDTIEAFSEARRKELIARWGEKYDDEELEDLENLFEGMKKTQNVVGELAINEAKKLCKISLDIDNKIMNGEPIDKLIASYDKMKSSAGFSTNAAKNLGDLESVGELVAYLEKTGWENPYYSGVSQDIVDETIANLSNYVQRLYTNETNIGDSITERINAIKLLRESENIFDQKPLDLDEYERQILEEVASSQEFEEEV